MKTIKERGIDELLHQLGKTEILCLNLPGNANISQQKQ